MIITQLLGGLGNQMFQYAIGKNIALRNTCLLKLNTEFYNNPSKCDTKRQYQLSTFNIEENIATVYDMFQCKRIIKENVMKYDNAIFDLAKPFTLLSGFWQCEKYFKDIRNILLNEFTLKAYSDKYMFYMTNINIDTISVHVRRGDYVSNKTTNKYHGVCELDYYNNALKHIKYSNIYIFTDDKEWVKDNFKIDKCEIITELTDAEELLLMSKCSNNIIANSTFSWWGAWLNTNSDKKIIAPKKWFENENANINQEILLNEWIKI